MIANHFGKQIKAHMIRNISGLKILLLTFEPQYFYHKTPYNLLIQGVIIFIICLFCPCAFVGSVFHLPHRVLCEYF